ncbi:hypothetical protein FSW04_12745 [Baekduia soli]|uniref:Uncharacterized protein n=1 Tax=Baekduia soli TaxID=496014 RepID=A0A5B8U5Q1_9ACTN|nr:hypothetical protein [Baekduia soli]QEC48350.1 hypothetical protein FSW04_12745 [Baekduia soli]
MSEHPLDTLERRLMAAAERQVAARRDRRTPRRGRIPRSRRALALVAALTSLLVGGGAWAATSLLSVGSPVPAPYRFGAPAPGRGLGLPVPGTVHLLTTTVADPAGGLPWGLRSFATSRGFTCVQVGRVLQGRIGLLGTQGAFGGDGRFHELRVGVIADGTTCVPHDGAGQGFLGVHLGAVPAGGAGPSKCIIYQSGRQTCPDRDLRSLDYGLLGPRATRVTYRTATGTRTVRALGPGGGYLVVGPRAPTREIRTKRGSLSSDMYLATLTPDSSVIARVDYGAGESCRVVPTLGLRGACADPPGFVPVAQPAVGAVRTPIAARVVDRRVMRVRFTARVAVVDATSAYTIMVYPPASCAPQGAIGTEVEHDVAAGGRVIKDVPMPCRRPGTYRVVVSYRTQARHPRVGTRPSLQDPGKRVGTLAVRLG